MVESRWLSGFRDWLEQCPAAAVAACFPAYRPDLVQVLADRLGAHLVDFRKERLAPLGWQAAALPLAALGEAAEQAMRQGRPVVLQNAESLLAVHGGAARRAALSGLLSRPWPERLILPLFLYTADLPRGFAAAHVFDPAILPEESLVLRLAGVS